jgi:hypothetical protein
MWIYHQPFSPPSFFLVLLRLVDMIVYEASDGEERTSASVPPSKYPKPGTSNVKVHDNFYSSVLPHA